ncbi:hypothetical protein NBRC116588_03040 [Pyruvatibacter sp. HU-CL02332]
MSEGTGNHQIRLKGQDALKRRLRDGDMLRLPPHDREISVARQKGDSRKSFFEIKSQQQLIRTQIYGYDTLRYNLRHGTLGNDKSRGGENRPGHEHMTCKS